MFLVNSTRQFSPNTLFSKHCRAFASTKAELYQVSLSNNCSKPLIEYVGIRNKLN